MRLSWHNIYITETFYSSQWNCTVEEAVGCQKLAFPSQPNKYTLVYASTRTRIYYLLVEEENASTKSRFLDTLLPLLQ